MESKVEGTANAAFITGIDAGAANLDGLLDPVRTDYKKMQQIVAAFNNKVENLIDKQRNEYIQAYEAHMQDVQKELHSLREKVADIANDDTKTEKTETLKQNQKKYKEEALKLETDSDEILQKIKKLVRKIYTVEKSRDWMLKRLRQAKQEYNSLLKERNRLYEDWDSNTVAMSIASMSNASSYTLDLKAVLKGADATQALKLPSKDNAKAYARSRVQLDFKVERSSDNWLPAISGGSMTGKSQSGKLKPWDKLDLIRKPNESNNASNKGVSKSYSLPALGQVGSQKGTGNKMSKSKSGHLQLAETFANAVDPYPKKDKQSLGAENSEGKPVSTEANGAEGTSPSPTDVRGDQALARLIALRARRQEIREFLQSCAKSLHRGPWCRVKARPLPKLLEACEKKLENQSDKFRSEELLQLVCELAVYPDTYQALQEIFDSFVPRPENYMSDLEIQAIGVVQPVHRTGIDPIADELIAKFGNQSFCLDSSTTEKDELKYESITEEDYASDVAVDFRNKLNAIISKSEGPAEDTLRKVQGNTRPAHNRDTTSDSAANQEKLSQSQGLLDPDLSAYFKKETHARKLSAMQFYEKDDFLEFD